MKRGMKQNVLDAELLQAGINWMSLNGMLRAENGINFYINKPREEKIDRFRKIWKFIFQYNFKFYKING